MNQQKQKDAVADLVLRTVFSAIKGLPTEQVRDFTEMTVCACIGLMRGGAGDEYVRGFLQGALADLDKPSATYVSPSAAPH